MSVWVVAVAQRDDHPPAGRELLHQRRRDLGRRGGHQDRVVRRERAPAQGAVAHQHGDVADPGRLQRGRGRSGPEAAIRSTLNTMLASRASSAVW